MSPLAQIAHSSTHRLRLKIAKGGRDPSYFSGLKKKLEQAFTTCKVQANPLTGSIIVTGDAVDAKAVSEFGRSNALFRVESGEAKSTAMAVSIIAPLRNADRNLKMATDGRMDLPGAVFVALVIFGIIEIVRGNWRSPPWYTAFWYAFGLYSKTLFDQVASMEDVDVVAD